MIAKFNSYREFETPMLYVCSPGCLCRNGMLTNTAGILVDTSDVEIIPNFNATSQLNFRCYKVKRDDADENAHFYNLYNSLRNRRLIYADGIGFFMITNVEDGYDGLKTYKDISAESCEAELRTKNLPYIEDGTYKFYTGESGNPGMIEILMKYAPLWTLGEIDQTVVERYRTFEEVDFSKNILGFMLEDLQDAYECIFIFDIINRVVTVYDQANYVNETDIHITKDDFINSINISESSDDLYTALSVTNEDDLSINAVNPLGTNVIYNFNYYLDWMSSGLRSKVVAWQDLVNNYSEQYYNIQLSRYADLTSLSSKQADLDKLDTQLTMYKRCRENIVAEASDEDIAAYNSVIASVGGVEIPESNGYLWVMYADDSHGTGITNDPYGKRYIGLAWDKGTNVASNNASDYSWFTYRNGESFPRTVNGTTKYTWVVYADSTMSGMSNNPDEKVYMGVSIDNDSSTKTQIYEAYTWSLIEKGGIGINEILPTILDMIDTTQAAYDAKAAEIAALNSTLESKAAQVSAIQASVNMQTYFTTEEMDELSSYIIEGTYTDEYVTTTDLMTYAEIFEQMKILYDRGVTQLEKASYPTQEFSLDVENFIFVKEFERWSDQLETGCLINVEVADDDVALLFLTSFEVNYEDRKLKMTFGNRYNKFDPKALFDKFLGKISKTANTLAYIRDTIYPIKNGQFNMMKEALETSRTLTKNSVLSSANEQVTIDDTGYTGRRMLQDGTIDPKQIKINGRNIVFTDDAWETCKTAIGEILLGDGVTAYGINAEIIMGNIIYGNQLHIIDANGNDMFQVTEDNIMVRVGDAYAKQEDTIAGVDVVYCRASSPLVCNSTTITVDWSTTSPAWTNGEYIWQKIITTYDDGTTTESAPTCLSGATGQNGKGISNTDVKYAVSQDGVNHPTTSSNWSDTIPTYNEGDYLWTRTVITYTDNSTSTSYSVSRNGIDGIAGTNNAVVYLYKRSATPVSIDWDTTLTYNFTTHTLNSVPSGWSTTVPSGINALYMTAATASSNTNTDTIAVSEWAAPIVIAANGTNSATVFLYQRAADSSLITKPSTSLTYTFATGSLSGTLGNWSQNIPASNGEPCFVIQATVTSISETDTILSSEWSAIRELVTDGVGVSGYTVMYAISNSGGTPPSSGWSTSFPQDLSEGEYLWTRTVTSYTDGDSSTVYSVSRDGITGRGISSVTNKYAVSTSSTNAPTVWQSSVPNLTATNKYLWNFETIHYDDGTSSETEKRVIGVYGDQGVDGIGISSITEYYLASTESSGVTTSTAGWTTGIQTVTASKKYLWNYEVVTYTNDNTWSSTPVIIGMFSKGITTSTVRYAASTSGTEIPVDGWQVGTIPTVPEGSYLWTESTTNYNDNSSSITYSVSRSPLNGANTAIVYLYKRSSSAPSIDWTKKLVYSFTTNKIVSLPTGWSDSIPDGNDPIYMTAATASSNGTSDQIEYTEFTTPIKIAQNGANGANGVDGLNSATVFLYQRATSSSGLSKPSGALTYTFATGAVSGTLGNWSQSIPASNGNPCFVIQATAISTSNTDTIASSEWSDIRKLVEDGQDGQDGVGISSSTVLYAKSSSGTTAPSSGWSTTIPSVSEGEYLWTQSTLVYTNGNSHISYSVSRNAVNGTNGKNSAIVYLYKRSSSAATVDWTASLTYNFTTNKLTSTPSGWSDSIPSGTNPIYVTAATASSNTNTDTIAYTEWSTPVILAQNGQDGAQGGTGSSMATVFLYQRASSSSAIAKPTGTLTYTFATGALSGTLGGWSQNIPTANGNPCFVIQATAIGTGATDTIAKTEWSDIRELVADGVGISNALIEYKTSSSGSTPPSSGWSTSMPSQYSEGEYLWTRTTTTYTDGDTSVAYSVSKNGTTGATGATGRGIASIANKYAVSSSNSTAPSSWQNSPPNMTATNKYLWNYEIITYDDNSTSETEKRVIGVYGTKGDAGKGISSITEYYLASASGSGITTSTSGWTTTAQTVTGEAPYLWNYEVVTYTDSTTYTSTPVIIGMFSNSITSSTVSYATSTSGTTVPTSGWQTGTIPSVSAGRYLWTRSVTEYAYGDPVTTYSVSRNPTNGTSNVVVRLYKRSSTAATVDWTTSLTYTFSSNSLSAIPSGWSTTIPSGTDPIYMTAATASGTGTTDSIAYTEWASPIVIAQNGTNGTNGLNTATILLYQRAASASGLTKPSSTLTYTFASGTLSGTLGSWSQSIPSVNGNPCFVIQATAVSSSSTDTILSSEWSEIRELVVDGEDGLGVAGTEVTYTTSTDGSTPPTVGWDTSFPSSIPEGRFLWIRTVMTYTDGNSTTSYSVSHNGSNGNHTAVAYLYKRSSSAVSVNWTSNLTYSFATNSLTSTPSGWSQSIPSGTNPVYMTAATASSSGDTATIAYTQWATPVIIARDGSAGSDGANSATVFLYQRAASASSLTKPSGSLTYTFATGAVTGSTLGNWSTVIPENDGNPCYVIQATAVSTSTTDTIASTEWSDIHEFVANGDGIGIESASVTYAVSESGDTPPSTGWTDVFPGQVAEGYYLWTRTLTTYTDGESSTAYSVSASGVGIESIEEEYYMSSSDSTLSDGNWTTTPPSWVSGYYIWTRSHIYWSNGNETTTTPVLNQTLTELNASIGDCTTEIEINKQGIQQNTEYYNDLYGKVTKINAYIQTGVLSYDENGRATYGVKIGENLTTADAYIVSGSTALSSGWLSSDDGGAALTPSESVIYVIKTAGTYYGKTYKWNGSAYEEANSDGTLSSVFTSSELGFYDTGEKTAYFSNKYLNVRTVRTNKILLSPDVISDTSTNNWQIGVDNGFYLKWIGATA